MPGDESPWEPLQTRVKDIRRPDLTLLLIPAIATLALITSHIHPTHRIPIIGMAAILCVGVIFDALFRKPPHQ